MGDEKASCSCGKKNMEPPISRVGILVGLGAVALIATVVALVFTQKDTPNSDRQTATTASSASETEKSASPAD